MTSYQWRIDASTASLAKLADDLRCYFRQRVNNTGDAEDLVGQTWLAAGRTFEGRASLRYYLYAIAKRLVSRYWGRKPYRPWIYGEREDPETLVEDGPAVDQQLARQAEMDRLILALTKLPRHYAEVIELTLQGHGHVAIAERLGVNYNTVRSRYKRGKAQLLRILESDRDSGQRDT